LTLQWIALGAIRPLERNDQNITRFLGTSRL
jgi:hypothetical protein